MKKALALFLSVLLVITGSMTVFAASGTVGDIMYTANLSVSETQVYSYLSLESTSGSSDLQGKMSGTVYLTLGTASTTATIYKVGSSVTEYSKYDNYGSITRAYCEYYGDGTYLTSLTRYA